MCRLAGVSRAGFYRFLKRRHPAEEDMEVRAAIHEIVLEHRSRYRGPRRQAFVAGVGYGYRRVAAELARRGMRVNRKRVARLMRQDNLLGMQPRAFVATTDSDHELEVYLNLAQRMKLTGINQLWVADITYIRLRGEFVYLALVLDAFSRMVVGWELGRTLTARLPLMALERAVAERQPPPGLVHHSDRGTQYASAEYAAALQKHRMWPSMSRPANPYDNAQCESFIKTLKREEIHAGKYHDIADLRAHIEEFIDRYYNRQRLHSALGYKTPEEFEAALLPPAAPAGASVSFLRHGEIYRWGKKRPGRPRKAKGETVQPASPPHRIDESPVGYSLAGCSPAEPASASPTGTESDTTQPK
jgi:putative transposase